MRGCPQASNVFDDSTSKYCTIIFRCKIAPSAERKTDIWEGLGTIPRDSTYFEFYSFIASEAPTVNAANVNMLDLSVAYEVQSIQYEP
jgi:hypothetical protein